MPSRPKCEALIYISKFFVFVTFCHKLPCCENKNQEAQGHDILQRYTMLDKPSQNLGKKSGEFKLTNTQVAQIERLIRSLLGLVIGLSLTILFTLVILGVLFIAAQSSSEQGAGLLNTLLTMMASTLAGVTGYVFGRGAQEK